MKLHPFMIHRAYIVRSTAKHASFIYIPLSIHASISNRILTPYRTAVKYLLLLATTDRSTSSKGTSESHAALPFRKNEERVQFDANCIISFVPSQTVHRINFNS